MSTTTGAMTSLTADLAKVQQAHLSMNDMFLAEAALIAREFLLEMMAKHQCQLEDVTAEAIIAELKQRSLTPYSLPVMTSRSCQG